MPMELEHYPHLTKMLHSKPSMHEESNNSENADKSLKTIGENYEFDNGVCSKKRDSIPQHINQKT
jgi:hypothetical protein